MGHAMNEPSPELLQWMTAAARERAAGTSWAGVGRELAKPLEECSRWPAEYPEVWRRLYHAAELALRKDVRAEAIFILRQLVRANDDKIRLAAAQQLLKLQAKPRPRPVAAVSDDDVEAAGFIRELRGLNDGDLDALERKCLVEAGGTAGTAAAPVASAPE